MRPEQKGGRLCQAQGRGLMRGEDIRLMPETFHENLVVMGGDPFRHFLHPGIREMEGGIVALPR